VLRCVLGSHSWSTPFLAWHRNPYVTQPAIDVDNGRGVLYSLLRLQPICWPHMEREAIVRFREVTGPWFAGGPRADLCESRMLRIDPHFTVCVFVASIEGDCKFDFEFCGKVAPQ
jgi:hypothetical protein